MLGALLALGVTSVSLSQSAEPRVQGQVKTKERSKYTLFESGQVRPLALTPDGKLLLATNTPDNRLEIFKVTKEGLSHLSSVSVGLEPVAVAVNGKDEAWVVNHLSDSVSIVDLRDPRHPRTVRTLLVGDEPSDIVFAGKNRSRAFITTAHRGQNVPYDPQVTTPGVGRADVWVFDTHRLGTALGGTPLSIINLFTDAPRALATTADGSRVYAAGFHTGNRTTAVSPLAMPPGTTPAPTTNFEGIPQPPSGLIIKHNGQYWADETGRNWDPYVRFSLPDKDVFVIDAMREVPAQLEGPNGFFTGVGTTLYGLAVNPANGNVYVSNTEALNHERFIGPGRFAGKTLRGRTVDNRITVLSAFGAKPRDLNKHIDYSQCCAPIPNQENRNSLALPQGMEVSRDGKTLYVAALGSNKIGVFATAELENNTFIPDASRHISIPHGGPIGLVLDEDRDRLYVLRKFDNSIAVVDTRARKQITQIPMFNAEPESVTRGRPYLYDASFSSSRGNSACASCHAFGDMDHLAWDLGNPDAKVVQNPGPFLGFGGQPKINPDFFPMPGPMLTQSLRGLANHGAMHWRGDRRGDLNAPNAQPNSGVFNERAAFQQFRANFTDQLGRHEPISPSKMEEFADFVLQLTYPPNPYRALNNALTPDQQAGYNFFFHGPASDGAQNCGTCHITNRSLNPDSSAPGVFGSDGRSGFAFLPQMFKVPQLRNIYTRIGMFGMPELPIFQGVDTSFQSDQIRGFGFFHDGTMDTLFRIMHASFVAQTPDNPGGFPADGPLKRQMESFLFVYDSNLAPIVGQQVTLRFDNAAVAAPRISLLIERSEAGECDLIAKAAFPDGERGFLYRNRKFIADQQRLPALTDAQLREHARVRHIPITYTCAPPGSGWRMGVDRNDNGVLDGDEPRRMGS